MFKMTKCVKNDLFFPKATDFVDVSVKEASSLPIIRQTLHLVILPSVIYESKTSTRVSMFCGTSSKSVIQVY